jgi:hypothetical protein
MHLCRGEPCVEVLVRLINREPVGSPLHLLRPELVIRESAAVATRDERVHLPIK